MHSYNLGLRFDEISGARNDNIAIIFPEEAFVNYRELNEMSNRIARYMLKQGISKGDVVCISGEKDVLSFATMIGALKIGVIYCMLDPESPLERIYKILSTCAPRMILAGRQLLESLHTFDISPNILPVPKDTGELETKLHEYSPDNLAESAEITATHPAYIMFTSGSTGTPKGAVITHGGVLNLIQWSQKTYNNGPGEILTNVNPLYFDNSVFDFYSALFTGATLVPFSKAQVTNPGLLLNLMDRTGCTQWFSVPSMLIFLQTMKALTADRFKHLKRIIFGGEGYPKATLEKLYALYKHRITFHNVYGPTECTCICSTYQISDSDFEDLNGYPPLGSVIEKFDYLIVDENNVPVLPDTYGELCLMGPNVGLGYYNEEALTQKSFVQNPLVSDEHQVLYKTGDLVKYSSSDNKIYIRGRVDNQIKHMGYRIELEEIETALNQIDYISQAVVVHGQFRGLSRMVAAVCTTSEIDDTKLRQELCEIIPKYMIPNAFHMLGELPKNANGKVDRKKVSEMYFEQEIS